MIMKSKCFFARATMLLFLAVLSFSRSWAEDSKIVVWLNDGTKTEVLFNQAPEFVYADVVVSIANGGTELSWPLAQLKKFTFEDIQPSTPTAVKDVKSAARLDIVRGCSVYDINGRLIKKRIDSLTELPRGTYIVKDGSVTTKVVRR